MRDFLAALRNTGLGTLPGTAAEILDDEVREVLCPDKIRTREWLDVVGTAHEIGLRSTATIMFGHVDHYRSWARHLLAIRDLPGAHGGFTEMVPLPFVHMEAPIFRKGFAREGPTFREAVLMHAVSRLALHPHVSNIQVSWTKMGMEGAKKCLEAGANDLGGTLMNESISRAAGAAHGQELPPAAMEEAIRSLGRTPRQRTTLYGDAANERRLASLRAAPLAEVVLTPRDQTRPCELTAAATPHARRSSDRPRDALHPGRPDGPGRGSPATSSRTREPTPRVCDPPAPRRRTHHPAPGLRHAGGRLSAVGAPSPHNGQMSAKAGQLHECLTNPWVMVWNIVMQTCFFPQERARRAFRPAISSCRPFAGTTLAGIPHHRGGAPTTRAAPATPSGPRNEDWPCPARTAPRRHPAEAREPKATPHLCPI